MANTTIGAGTLAQYFPPNFGATFTMGIWCTQKFTADDGTIYLAGTGNDLASEFITRVAGTVSSNVGTFAAFTLPQTDLATPANVVRYYARIFDSRGAATAFYPFEDYHLRSSLGSSVTYLQWVIDNNQKFFQPIDTKPNTADMNAAIAAAISISIGTLNDASSTVKGRTKLSVNPASATSPIAVGHNDPRMSGITILTNSTTIGQRPTLNIIPGANTSVAGVDNSGSNQIDLTISATGAGAGATFASPTASVGLTAVNGSAITAMRSDAAPALSQAIAPTWSATHTFTLAPVFSAMTPGSVLLAGTAGILLQDNANFFWDATNRRLGIGTAAPGGKLQIDTAAASNLNTLILNQLDTTVFAQDIITAGRGVRIRPSGSPTTTSPAFAIGTGANDGNLFKVQQNGNVGIGTSTPGQLLEVAGNIFSNAATANLYLKDTSTGFQSASTTVITPQVNNAIRSTSYTAGLVGWNVSALGNAEFNNLDVRGAIHSSVFVFNELQATAGTLGIFKSAAKLRTDATVPASPTYGTTTINIDVVDQDGVSHAASQLFIANDVLRLKDGMTGDTWFKVSSASDQTTFWRYVATIMAGSNNVTYRAGAGVADYGQSGSGFIILTADQTNAPYEQMATHTATFSSQDVNGSLVLTPQLRSGNLNGSYGFVSDTFGFATGQYGAANKTWLTVEQTNGIRIGNNATQLAQWDTSGNILVGQTGAGQSNVYITAGAVRLRNNATDVIVLDTTESTITNLLKMKGASSAISIGTTPPTSATVGTGIWIDRTGIFGLNANTVNFKIDATNGNLTASNATLSGAITATSGSITGPLTMSGASSSIAIGTTPPTSATVGTGIWLDRTGLYGLVANVLQAKFDAATGAITAGAGNVKLDANGLSLTGGTSAFNYVSWFDSGTEVGRINGQWGGTVSQTNILSISKAGDSAGNSQLTLTALNNSSIGALLRLQANGSGAGANYYAVLTGTGGNITGLAIAPNSFTAPVAMLDVRGGVVVGSVGVTPTGGDKGAGTINLGGDIYKNNTAYTNPDYVLEHWATGNIEKYIDKEGAREYKGLQSLTAVREFAKEKFHLPRFGQNAGHGLFGGGDSLLASLEEAYIYIFELENRIASLERKAGLWLT